LIHFYKRELPRKSREERPIVTAQETAASMNSCLISQLIQLTAVLVQS